ncbi:hypothetical protein [Clostridium uliginosum]|uniref:WXG100 family type VII secretion target n=1 Tax=Clostridium uliginosum TaxID=119641 RepID=A0A1I1R0X5_9CLOT|nr:hypothetical protein [Clostridium uliginosum]SFD27979.1 hypothetical protein SAMN05421842_12922 [Clostridium uliginosum]
MLYKLDNSIHDNIGDFMKANKTMQESLDKVNAALAILDTDVWTGKSKDSAISLMLILKKYHEALLSVAEDNLDTMLKLETNASEYMQNGKMPSLWK